MTMPAIAPGFHGAGDPEDVVGALSTASAPSRETDHMIDTQEDRDHEDQEASSPQERFVRLSVNLSNETAQAFKTLIRRKGLSITEGVRRAIAVWKFLEDETASGNQIAVIERDDSVRKVVLL